jgi:hypothetical protein
MRYTIFFTLLTLLSACHSSVNNYGFKDQNLKISDLNELKTNFDDITTIKVPSDSWKKPPVEIYNLIDTIFSVQLETNRNNLIGYVDEIKIYKDRIYVLDKRVAKMIYAFDIKGRFIGTVGKKGKGPGEYLNPEGMEIDKVNNEIIVVSVANRKFLRYDLIGNFLGDFNVEVAFADFKILDNGNFVLLAGDEPNAHLGEDVSNRNVYVTDNRGKIIAYGPKFYTAFKDIKITRNANLMVQNNEISYSYKLSDTIFQVNNNEITAKYIIDLGSFALDREILKNKNTQDYINALDKTKDLFLYSGEHFQTKDYLLFKITIDRSVLTLFYNKNNNKLYTSMAYPTHLDYWMGSFVSSYQDYFIASMDAPNLLIEIENLKINDLSQLKKIYANMGLDKEFDLSDSDNPILFFIKFKKD